MPIFSDILSTEEQERCDADLAAALTRATDEGVPLALEHFDVPEERLKALELWLAGVGRDMEIGIVPTETDVALDQVWTRRVRTADEDAIPEEVLKRETAIAVLARIRDVSGQIGLRILRTKNNRNHGLAVAGTLLQAGSVDDALEVLRIIDGLPPVGDDEWAVLSRIATQWKEQNLPTTLLRGVVTDMRYARGTRKIESWLEGFQQKVDRIKAGDPVEKHFAL